MWHYVDIYMYEHFTGLARDWMMNTALCWHIHILTFHGLYRGYRMDTAL
jgi:hypothetical protein